MADVMSPESTTLSNSVRAQVGVGITIAHDPLHGSGRAGFPHPALALGDNAHAPQRIGMTDRRQRQPASDETPHAIPQYAAVLAAPRQRAVPEPTYLEPKNPQRRCVHGHAVISNVPTHHCLQPLAQFGDGFVHPSLKLGFHLVQLRLQPFADRLPQHRVPSIAPLLHTVRYSLRPAKLLAILADLTGYFSLPTAAFTSRLSAGRSPFPPLDITTVATEQVPPAGLSPAGTSTSIAGPTSHSYDSLHSLHLAGLTGAQEHAN